MLHEEYGKELPELLQRHVLQLFSHTFSPKQFVASEPHILGLEATCDTAGAPPDLIG
jgi:hypothetical protein